MKLKEMESMLASSLCMIAVWVLLTAVPGHAASSSALSATNVDATLATLNTEFPKFMSGVGDTYGRDWDANAFALWSPNGFVVARSPAVPGDTSSMMPTVVAVPLASGSRVVAFGSPVYLSGACCGPEDSTKRMVMNAVKWLSQAGNRSTTDVMTYMAIVVEDPTKIYIDYGLSWVAQAIARLDPSFRWNVTFIAMTDLLRPEVTNGVNLFFIDSYNKYTAEQAKALTGMVLAGKPARGLLVAGRYWADGGNAIVDLPVNRILWPLGLAYTAQTAYGIEGRPASTPTNWLFYNTLYLASRLREAQSSSAGARQISTSAYQAANMGTKLLIFTLCARAKNGSSVIKQFNDVWKALEAARPRDFGGVGPGDRSLDVLQSPPAYVLDASLDTAYIRNADITRLNVSRSAAAYPGLPQPPTAPTEVVNVTVDGTFPGQRAGWSPYRQNYFPAGVWRPTGVYAPPGVRVTSQITFPGAAVGVLKLQIGYNPDDISFASIWPRVPCATSVFDLRFAKMDVGSPLGGPIYIFVPDGATLGKVSFTFTNVIRAPYFKFGATEVGIWSRTVSTYPGPRAELAGHRVALMVPSQSARCLADPRPIISYWDRVVEAMDWLANINRTREERLTNDVPSETSDFIHNGYPVMLSSGDDDLLSARPSWVTLNILGRNFLTDNMASYGYGLANLFVVYAKEWVEGIPVEYQRPETSSAAREAARKAYISSGYWYEDWRDWVELDTYLQLAEGFGWEFYPRVYAIYQAHRDDPSWSGWTGLNMQDQTWIIVTSEAAGRNLIPFYQAWKFPLTSWARSTVLAMKLPLWEANPMKAYAPRT